MKLKNFTFIISLLIIFIVTLGAVSADDGLDDLYSDSDNHSNVLMSDDDSEDDDSEDWEDDDSEDDDSEDWEDDDSEDDDFEDYDDEYTDEILFDSDDLKDIDLSEIIKARDYKASGVSTNPKVLPNVVSSSAMIGEAAGAEGSSDGSSNDDLDDSEETDDSSSEEEMGDFSEDAPLATSDLTSGSDDGDANAASQENSSDIKVDLTSNVTGHPILMLILSLFGLFIVPFNKR